MFTTKTKIISLFVFTSILCFFLGFSAAKSVQETSWLGHLVHGIYDEPDPSVFPKPDEYSPAVKGDIKIGLREDGVVVWKRAGTSDK